jgi:hypothetical protein
MQEEHRSRTSNECINPVHSTTQRVNTQCTRFIQFASCMLYYFHTEAAVTEIYLQSLRICKKIANQAVYPTEALIKKLLVDAFF